MEDDDCYELDGIWAKLHEAFDMKDLRDVRHLLGMCITRDRKQGFLWLSQKEYVRKVLERFNMVGGKALSTPLPPYVKLSQKDNPKSDGENAKMAKVPYASTVGNFMYAINCYEARHCICSGSC